MRQIDKILLNLESHCHSGGGNEFPNADTVRLLAAEVERLRGETFAAKINHAATVLPEGFEITVHVEHHAGWICLENPDGDEIDYPSNQERIEETFDDAIEHAIELDAARKADNPS